MVREDCLLKPHTIELHPWVLAQDMHCNRDFLSNTIRECPFEQVAQDMGTAITQKSQAWWDVFALCWIERPHA